MKPSEFVKKWAASTRTERAASQEHFIDLCRMLGEPTPNEADPTGDFYAFEKGAEKTTGGDGFADVWLKDRFGWEYKGKRKDLRAAYQQLVGYQEALGHPPLLVVSDMARFEVHTKWTNTESWTCEFSLLDLTTDSPVKVTAPNSTATGAPQLTAFQVLKALFEDPDRLKPGRTTDAITKEAAANFYTVAETLRKWSVDHMRIARFVSRALFCMFASDVGLLPKGSFSAILKEHQADAKAFQSALSDLFRTMRDGGRFGAYTILHFNGDLFADADVPVELSSQEIRVLEKLDALNWADVEPSIFGTLFERVLDVSTRAKLGAYYTSREDIETLVEPVLMAPLRREWDRVREAAMEGMLSARTRPRNPKPLRRPEQPRPKCQDAFQTRPHARTGAMAT